jgi:hypothetical protein
MLISHHLGATARGSGIVPWGDDCACSAAVVGTLWTPSSGLSRRVERSEGGPIPGEPNHGLG